MTQSGNDPTQIRRRHALPDSYPALLQELKQRIREAQLRASVSVNRELVLLYWRIGREILHRQEREHWGAKVIDRLAADLKKAFPEIKGFSPRNLKYMRAFAEAWPEEHIVQQVAAQIPWFHNCVLLDKLEGRRTVSGMPKRPSNTAGVAMCWFTTSRLLCTSAVAQH